jgi:hypothetical protein
VSTFQGKLATGEERLVLAFKNILLGLELSYFKTTSENVKCMEEAH